MALIDLFIWKSGEYHFLEYVYLMISLRVNAFKEMSQKSLTGRQQVSALGFHESEEDWKEEICFY